ncbi:hypothetical protein [Okeania sp. SIO3I5]|uniref:hypothetical protein n=1 Tax=Okeania sp. SIO3I5 TaxID=2607805 RepID=UPI0025DBD125|nr:hypothetical protein [Okeania sp. SIO3I5]
MMILDKNWKNFLAANEVYKHNQLKFKSRPRLTRYKNKITGINIVVYTTQAISKRQLKKGIINPSKTGIYLKTFEIMTAVRANCR